MSFPGRGGTSFVTLRHLSQAIKDYPDAADEIKAWRTVVKSARWHNFEEVRQRFKDDAARKQLANGIDPVAERMARKTAARAATEHSFEKIAELWLDHWQGDKSARHIATTKNRLKVNVYPVLGGRPITEVEPMELVQLAKGIEARDASDMAKRILQIVGMVFRYSVAHGFSRRNPAAEVRPSDILKPTRKTNMARIDAKELPALHSTTRPRSSSEDTAAETALPIA